MDEYGDVFRELPLPAVLLSDGLSWERANEAFQSDFVERGLDGCILSALGQDLRRFWAGGEKHGVVEKNIILSGSGVKTFRVRLSRVALRGRPCALALFSDITERRRHMEEISRLASIVDSTDDAILSVSPDRKVLSWNPGARKIYGHSATAILHTSVMKLFPDSVASAMDALFDRACAGESFSRVETINSHEDGHIFPVSMTLSPLRRADGVVGVTIISRDISSRREAEEQLLASHRQLQNLMHETVESLSTAHEKRDLYTAGHQRTVSALGCLMADEMNLSHDRMEGVRIAGLLHDIGKVCIPMAILAKPARLSEEEMALMRKHPEAGYEIVKNIPFQWPVKQTILQHHERINGSGYPRGLSGGDICIEARILAVADVLEAMSSHRPYRAAQGLEAALAEISSNSGALYDPEVCRAAKKVFEGGALRLQGGRLVCSL